MTYSPSTTIKGPSAGSVGIFYTMAQKQGALRLADLKEYLETIYRVAPQVGLRAEVIVTDSILETGWWTSFWWNTRLNPAGIGITGDAKQNDASKTWTSGESAALAHLTHMWLYAVGDSLPTGLGKTDDPRWDVAVQAGRAGIAPTLAGLANTWAADADYATKIADRLNQIAVNFDVVTTPDTGGTPVATLTFGHVPFPSFTDRQSVTRNKPEGVGWNNLGTRTPRFIVLHRMEGNLQGTDSYFGMASTGALTDYGIGTAGIDGASRDGVIYQWNNPRGYRAGWASGPVSAPYGDGLNWLNWGYAHGYDVNIPNVCGVSMEISGDYNDPLSDTAFKQIAAFVAYWFDQLKVPYDKAPIGPDGISCVTWHQEWTIGTGKICPGPIVMNRTQELIDAAAAIMKPYQTAATSTPAPPTPASPLPPRPAYATPSPIAELAPYGIKDKDTAKAIVTAEGTKFTWVADTYKVTKQTKRYQFASLKAPSVGPDLKVDETLDILWTFTAANGSLWGYTAAATRIDLSCVERIKD